MTKNVNFLDKKIKFIFFRHSVSSLIFNWCCYNLPVYCFYATFKCIAINHHRLCETICVIIIFFVMLIGGLFVCLRSREHFTMYTTSALKSIRHVFVLKQFWSLDEHDPILTSSCHFRAAVRHASFDPDKFVGDYADQTGPV